MKNIHILICALCLLFTLPSIAQKQYDVRYSMNNMDCGSKKVCYDVQLRSTDGSSWGLAGQNYRLYYDASMVSFSGATSSLTPQQHASLNPNVYSDISVDYREQDLPPGFNGGLAFNTRIGFLNYSIDLNNLSSGGLNVTGDWMTTSTICFDVNDTAMSSGDCFGMVWGRASKTSSYSPAYLTVSEWQGSNATAGANGSSYNDLDANSGNNACFSTACAPVVTDPCATKQGDTDGDGICNLDDCSPANPNIPAAPGTPCSDGNPNTYDDAIANDRCSCVGIPVVTDPCATKQGDTDGDGICNLDDCSPANPNIPAAPGTPCSDGNPNTINDVIAGDRCSCVGTLKPPTTPYAGTKSYEIQFKQKDYNCNAKQVCYDVQLKSNTGTWQLGSQNYRLFYNSAYIEYANGTSSMPGAYGAYNIVQDLTHQTTSGGNLSFNNDIGFLNYSIDLLDEQNGGVTLTDTDWLTTSSICFDLTPTAINQGDVCLDLIWAREQMTSAYASAYLEMTEWTGANQLSPTTTASTSNVNNACLTVGCTPPPPPTCSAILVTNENNISISGLSDIRSLVYVVKDRTEAIFYCNSGFSQTCGSVVNLENLAPGNYSIWVNEGNQSCIQELVVIEQTSPCANNGGDQDNDGICAFNDCDDNNPNIGAKRSKGTACNDDNPATNNDVILADGCSCAGTINACYNFGGDQDNDGICAFNDCDDNNPNVGVKQPVGTACNDGNPATDNDLILAGGCSCAGTINPCYGKGGDSDGDGICDETDPCPGDPNNNCGSGPISCDDISVSGGTNYIEITNLLAPAEIVQVFNSKWEIVYKCQANCNETEVVQNLPKGKYYVVVGLFDASWKFICSNKSYVTVTHGGTSQPVDNTQTETCGEISVTYGDGKIEVTGQAGKSYYYKVARIRPSWSWILNCTSNCGSTQSMGSLTNGTYAIIVYDQNWKPACRGIQVVLSDGTLTSEPSSSKIIRQAEEMIEKEIQLAKPDWSDSETSSGEQATFTTKALDKGTYQVYPNPAKNELFVNLLEYANQKATIKLLNQLGQVIETINFDELPNETIQLNIRNTDNGLHVLTIQLENSQIITEKVMINK